MIEIKANTVVKFGGMTLESPNIRVVNQNEISKQKKVEVTVEFYSANYVGVIRTLGAYDFVDTWGDTETESFVRLTLGL